MNYYDIKTTSDYLKYVKATAVDIVDLAIERLKENEKPISPTSLEELIHDNGLIHEHIDADGIIIYYHGHNIILEHTDNADYLTENVGLGGGLLTNWTDTKAQFACWAFYGDVMDVLEEACEAQLHSHWQAGGRE